MDFIERLIIYLRQTDSFSFTEQQTATTWIGQEKQTGSAHNPASQAIKK
jgi:hypothetical protein